MSRKRSPTIQMDRIPHRHATKRLFSAYQLLLRHEQAGSDQVKKPSTELREGASSQESQSCQK